MKDTFIVAFRGAVGF